MAYLEDMELDCANCGVTFTWTGGERKFMERLLEDGKIEKIVEPRACPECRLKRKQRLGQV